MLIRFREIFNLKIIIKGIFKRLQKREEVSQFDRIFFECFRMTSPFTLIFLLNKRYPKPSPVIRKSVSGDGIAKKSRRNFENRMGRLVRFVIYFIRYFKALQFKEGQSDDGAEIQLIELLYD